MRPLNQFEEYLVNEFVDDYHDGVMTRRDMVARVLYITGGVASAATMLTSLGVRAADAMAPSRVLVQATPTAKSPESVPPDDPAVVTRTITYPASDGATITACEARPSGSTGSPGPAFGAAASPEAAGLPLILVCHENRGLTEYIRDVVRRLAKAGYAAAAPDLVSREGGTAANSPDQIPSILSGADPNRHVGDFQSAVDYYRNENSIDIGQLGMIGFCFGGGITWRAATKISALKAAVPFYGPPPPLQDVPNIKAAVLGVYSSDPGDFANKGRDELEQALKQAGITFEIKVYPDTQHAFHNDTGPRYNEKEALAAWHDALTWFGTYM